MYCFVRLFFLPIWQERKKVQVISLYDVLYSRKKKYDGKCESQWKMDFFTMRWETPFVITGGIYFSNENLSSFPLRTHFSLSYSKLIEWFCTTGKYKYQLQRLNSARGFCWGVNLWHRCTNIASYVLRWSFRSSHRLHAWEGYLRFTASSDLHSNHENSIFDDDDINLIGERIILRLMLSRTVC